MSDDASHSAAHSAAHDAAHDASAADALEQRLKRLESTVASLATRMDRLDAELRARGLASAPRAEPVARPVASPPPVEQLPPRPQPAPWRVATPARSRIAQLDLESLVGRYGTLVLGGLAVVLAVGAFLSWAVQRVTIGPEMRVALGAIAAAGIAALAVRLRRSESAGTRRFGSVLLALALAVTHVVAWGAGPGLNVLPSFIALGIAFVASAALAVHAWRSAEQALFVVGIGGALLAPFVTSAEAGDPFPMLLYGFVVLSAGAAALRDMWWPWATRVLASGALLYAGAALDLSWMGSIAGEAAWIARAMPAGFVLACALSALFLAGMQYRSGLTRLWLLVMMVPLFARAADMRYTSARWDLVVIALAGTALVYVALRLRDARQFWALPSALIQPPLFMAIALLSLPRPVSTESAMVVFVFAALATLAAFDAGLPAALGGWRRPEEDDGRTPRWSVHLLVAESMAALALFLVFRERPLIGVPVLAGYVIATTLLARRLDRPLALVAPAGVLMLASLWGHERLLVRTPWEYTPFLTGASIGAAALVVAWAVFGRVTSRIDAGPSIGRIERAAAAALGAAAALVWGREELARAFSPELSTFLLIAYFAVAGVLLILFGRRRGLPGGRRIGLALAVYAALKAIVQASDFDSIGLRVGSYLLVGGFLLAVAYWYRAAGEAERDAPGPESGERPAGEPTIEPKLAGVAVPPPLA